MGNEMALGGLPEDPADLGDAMIVLADPRSFSADALLAYLNDVAPLDARSGRARERGHGGLRLPASWTRTSSTRARWR